MKSISTIFLFRIIHNFSDVSNAKHSLPVRVLAQGYVSPSSVVDGQLVVEDQHLLHDLTLQRSYVEMEISNLFMLKIGHIEKFLGEHLVQPSPSGGASNCGNEFLQEPVEFDFGL